MADGENKNEIMDKLKELEVSLAKELDQKIRLAEPSDPRLEGQIDVNPNMADALKKAQAAMESQKTSKVEKLIMAAAEGQAVTQPSAAAEKNTAVTGTPVAGVVGTMVENHEKKVDDITLDDVDDILNQMDAGFQASMNEIKSELSQIVAPPNLESLPIGSDYLKEAEGKGGSTDAPVDEEIPADMASDVAVEIDPGAPLGAMLQALGLATLRLPIHAAQAIRKNIPQIKLAPREVVSDILQTITDDIFSWLGLVKTLVKKLLSYSAKTYLTLALFSFLVAAFLFLVHDLYRNFQNPDQEKDPFLRNFNDVADSTQVLREEKAGEDLESPLKHPEYTVLVHRMIANLKAPDQRYSPMITLELYVEASNQECAIEISNREAEIKDAIERVLEETTFDELDTAQGKVRLKVRLRRGINHVLSKGSVNRVMFKTLNIKK